VVLFDIDGVLADAAGRQHFLTGGRKDWDAFFAASKDDPLIEETARLLQLLDRSLGVLLLTARPATVEEGTVDWLARHELRWDLLAMRPADDRRPSAVVKREALSEVRALGLHVQLAFEDDLRNAEVFRAEGIPTVYIHSGYYA
jgi:hypothetical protein